MRAVVYVFFRSGCLKRILFEQLRWQQDLVSHTPEILPGRVRTPCGIPVHSLARRLPAGVAFFVSLGEKNTPRWGRFGTFGSGVVSP